VNSIRFKDTVQLSAFWYPTFNLEIFRFYPVPIVSLATKELAIVAATFPTCSSSVSNYHGIDVPRGAIVPVLK